jgi:hypothetical protein
MTSMRDLNDYVDEQASIVLADCAHILNRGYLTDPADLYPDIAIPSNVAYTRYTIPLPFLVLLYEKTSVFVPPLSEADLRKRWGTSLATVTALAQAGLIVPILARPTDYQASHFEPLLELRPPSLWARGVAMLDRLNMGSALVERDCPLPIESMAHVKRLRAKYSRYESGLRGEELTSRIKAELLLNYADLCIFGEYRLADSLASFRDPQQIVDRLHLANEVRTYPILFGLGGTANYDRRMLQAESLVAQTLPDSLPTSRSDILPSNLDLLFKGIDINIHTLTADDIISFHSSGQGSRLRSAMAYFERQAAARTITQTYSSEVEQLIASTSALEQVIRETAQELSSPAFIRKANSTQRALGLVLRVGSPALGGWLSHLAGYPVLEGVGGGAIVQQLVIEPLRDKVIDAGMIARFRPGLANLWRISKKGSAK